MKLTSGRLILIAAVACLFAITVLTTVNAALNKGTKAPNFKLKSIDGKTYTLSQIRKDPAHKGKNRVVLIDFWATWCPPCRNEVPHLQKLHEKYGKKGLAVVGIALDDSGTDAVKPFAEENGLKYTILVDPDAQAARTYGIRPIPTTYIIDKNGVIRNVHMGFSPGMEEQIEQEVQALLK